MYPLWPPPRHPLNITGTTETETAITTADGTGITTGESTTITTMIDMIADITIAMIGGGAIVMIAGVTTGTIGAFTGTTATTIEIADNLDVNSREQKRSTQQRAPFFYSQKSPLKQH